MGVKGLSPNWSFILCGRYSNVNLICEVLDGRKIRDTGNELLTGRRKATNSKIMFKGNLCSSNLLERTVFEQLWLFASGTTETLNGKLGYCVT